MEETETVPAADTPSEPGTTLLNSKTLNINKIDLKDLAIAQFGDWRADVESVTKQLTGVVHDLSTQAKVDEAKSLRFRLIGKPRATVRTVTKALKSKLASVSKAIGAEEDLAVAAYDLSETLITPQIEARETELEAERIERARIEAERVQGLRDKIAAIHAFVDKCHGISAERIARGIDLVAKLDTSKVAFAELDAAALAAQVETLQAMRVMHTRAVESEAESARIEAQRVENERVAAELKAKADAMAMQQAAIDKAAAELKATQDAAAKVEQDKRDAEAKAAKDKLDEQARQFAELEAAEIDRLAKLNNGDMVQEAAPAPTASIETVNVPHEKVESTTISDSGIHFIRRSVAVEAPARSAARAELDALLDRLTDAELPRITSFIRSRYPERLAA